MAQMFLRGLTPVHLDEIQREFNNFFDRTFGKLHPSPERTTLRAWSPNFDMFEHDGEIVVKVDLPGISKDDINISIKGDMLTVYGDRKTNEKIDEEDYHYHQRSHGKFRRDIQLPQGIDIENIKASYENGVLDIVMPEKEGVKPSKMEVPIE
jgi:HSP20 family protein